MTLQAIQNVVSFDKSTIDKSIEKGGTQWTYVKSADYFTKSSWRNKTSHRRSNGKRASA
ncbi:hypothetical protein EXIGUO8H_10119 [Exiguobacterium sp. 8H]|nr:hypothetical protein EXIGUO8A_10017 [Exiguobacterium sp. 8A]VXA95425.1 hypothetical protein EXIGUO8H_10119 [Exiguobacterium sp. 8H]